jgi:hypothetical protein
MNSPAYNEPGPVTLIRKVVYEIYNRVLDKQDGIPEPKIPGWLDRLVKLPRGRCTLQLQSGEHFEDFDSVYNDYRKGNSEATAKLRNGFIHFYSPTRPGAVKRVYINAVPRFALDILEHLLEFMTSNAPKSEFRAGGFRSSSPLGEAVEAKEHEADAARDFHSCKIAGPSALGGRTDGIIVYCPSAECVEGVLALLSRARSAWFGAETPRLTRRADSLELSGVGVSIGDEPPQVATGLSGHSAQSFGSLRAELVTAAAIEAEFSDRLSRDPGDFRIFCDRVTQAFRGYGLDPNKPWANG